MYDDKSPMGMSGAFDTDHAAAVIVIGALVFLILIRRGFRGVSVAGLSASVR